MAQETAVGPRGSHSFIAVTPKLLAYLGEEPAVIAYSWLDPQRTSYGYGYGSSVVPGWTRPFAWRGLFLSPSRLRRRNLRRDSMVVVIIIHNIRSGDRPYHSELVLAVAVHHNSFAHTPLSAT
jgi:hypothetical protein